MSDKLVLQGPGSVGQSTVHEAVFFKGGTLSDNNFFDQLTLSPGYDYQLRNGATQTIAANGAFLASGSNCGSLVTIKSDNTGSLAFISKAGAAVVLQYVRLMDIHAGGGAAFSASNSVDLGNNSGWTILSNPPRTLYWVGGGGNWSDAQHWSGSSGGTGGECPPAAIDDVFFDANSGFTPGQNVQVDAAFAYCKNMDWSGVQHSPVLAGGNFNAQLMVYGTPFTISVF